MKSQLNEIHAFVNDRDKADLDDLTNEQANNNISKSDSVRCSTVDNFQGEEATIIVVSLVRSNTRGNIGFLKEEQRVNVLLSRAQHGMFLVGNTNTFLMKAGSKVWQPIIDELKCSGRVLKGLPSTCQLHPQDPPILLCKPADFRRYRPNGGCTRQCNFRMECGHACNMMCHPVDRSHEKAQAQCQEACRRTPPDCPHDHPCTKLCKEKCGPCQMEVGPVRLLCDHEIASVWCHKVGTAKALAETSKHCKASVDHVFKSCGHEASTTCSNVQSDNPMCPANCGVVLGCGHPCQNR